MNTGIPRREYLGAPHSYCLPSVADLGKRLVEQGQGAYIWSADVSGAYRQLLGDPIALALVLFVIIINGRCYVDVALPFGCGTYSTTDVVVWLMRRQGFLHTLIYVDDFVRFEVSFAHASSVRVPPGDMQSPGSPPRPRQVCGPDPLPHLVRLRGLPGRVPD